MDSGMFYGIQQGAIKALQLDNSWFKTMNDVYKKRRAIAWQIFDALHISYDVNTSGLFVWGKIPDTKKSEAFADELLYNHDVFMTPGTVFGPNGEGYIRLSLCVSEEKLKEILKRVQND